MSNFKIGDHIYFPYNGHIEYEEIVSIRITKEEIFYGVTNFPSLIDADQVYHDLESAKKALEKIDLQKKIYTENSRIEEYKKQIKLFEDTDIIGCINCEIRFVSGITQALIIPDIRFINIVKKYLLEMQEESEKVVKIHKEKLNKLQNEK